MVYIHIDNNFVEDDFPENVESNFAYKLSRPINNVELMNLKYARLPVMPTVISGWNDTVYYYCASDGSGATLLSATIPAGYYTPDEFVAELNSEMTANATSCTFNSTYDPNTAKMTLIGSENTRLATQALVETSDGANNAKIFARMSLILGYNDVLITATTSIEMSFIMNMTSVRYFTLVIELNGFQNPETVNRTSSYSFTVPNFSDELQGNAIYKEENFSQYNHINHVNVNRLNVKTFLEDDRSNTNFLNGFLFEYLLEFVQGKKYAYVGRSRK